MSAPADARLVLVVEGSEAPPVELPRSGVLTLGSEASRVDVVLQGAGVADVHCAIGRARTGGWALKDLGSGAGTRVNGEPVRAARLKAGDVLALGETRLRVVDPSAAAAGPPAQTVGPTAEAAGPAAEAAGPLPSVAGYRLERRLGRGSMGAVYLAVQESLGRPVALKILAPRLATDTDFVRRFQDEARAAAALNHPSVVTVHDVGEDGGHHYLSMEYMARGSLESRLAREGRIDWHDVIGILHHAASGLVYAESRGIVHRDIKPANLMQDEVGTTKIADLGLAISLEAEAAEGAETKVFGTPHFVAPEQARGEAVDGRADLYALGATTYRLLSGRTPFEGSTTREILRGHFTETPRPLAEAVPEVPDALQRIVHRLLEKRPEDRFPSAGELLAEVDRLRSESLHGAGLAPADPRARRRRLATLAAAVILIAVAPFALRALRGLRGQEDAPTPGEPAGAPTWAAGEPGSPVLAASPEPLEPKTGATALGGGVPERSRAEALDDDAELRRLEMEARVAFYDLPDASRPLERRQALHGFAREFAGTTAATRALEEAQVIAAALETGQGTPAPASRAQESVLAALRRGVAGDAATSPERLAALVALADVPGQEALAADDGFLRARSELYASALVPLVAAAHEARSAVQASLDRGDFPGVEAAIDGFLPGFRGDEVPPGLGGAAWAELVETHAELLRLRDDLEWLERRHAARAQQEDAARLAAELRGGLGDDLTRLDLDAARARLESVRAELTTDGGREWADGLDSDVEDARSALASIAGEFDRDGWKRRRIVDPRQGHTADVVGADAAGLRIEVDGGAEHVSWAAFGARPEALHQLFKERLHREWTAAERRGIEFLMRSAAVARGLELLGPALAEFPERPLRERDVRAVVAAFDAAEPWARACGDASKLEGEREAAGLLVDALERAREGGWSACTARIERLLRERPDTLWVRFLSDGRGLAPPLPERSAPDRPESPAPPDGEGG